MRLIFFFLFCMMLSGCDQQRVDNEEKILDSSGRPNPNSTVFDIKSCWAAPNKKDSNIIAGLVSYSKSIETGSDEPVLYSFGSLYSARCEIAFVSEVDNKSDLFVFGLNDPQNLIPPGNCYFEGDCNYNPMSFEHQPQIDSSSGIYMLDAEISAERNFDGPGPAMIFHLKKLNGIKKLDVAPQRFFDLSPQERMKLLEKSIVDVDE
ncbi:hypothetical protein [Parasphingorhabdus sp.]|uniref:hypothetical protein n=1 Tax=Parasphingorhabdus sp. TaxID=2709688 RepID=UPI003266BFD4